MKLKHLAAAGALAAFAAVPVQAAVVTLDFEGVGNAVPVGDFYNGGAGANYGVDFSDGSLGVVDSDDGGLGNIGNEPSGSTVLVFLDTQSAIMNVAAGFSSAFSFFYSSVTADGTVKVYDGLDGTGNVLASYDLTGLGFGPGDPKGIFSIWKSVSMLFSGTARSVNFVSMPNQIVYDDISFNTDAPAPVPVPAAGVLLLAALGALAGLRRRKTA